MQVERAFSKAGSRQATQMNGLMLRRAVANARKSGIN
jgi:hypothetical protein